MTFYGIDYLQNSAGINDYLKYGLLFGALILLIVAFSGYLRHRLNTKYRDVSIMLLLFLLFILGVQYSDYTQAQSNHSQSSMMVGFVKKLARDQDVGTNQVYVNSTQLTDGTLVLIDDQLYRVSLSPDTTNYSLTEVALTNQTITKQE